MKRVGIDIGSSAVRVVEVDGTEGPERYARVTKIGIAPLGHNAVRAGRIHNKITVAQAVAAALRKAGVSGYGAVVGIASPQCAIRQINILAAVKPEERPSTLRLGRVEVAPNVPIADSNISISHMGDGIDTEGRPVARTVVAAVQRTAVESVLEVCQTAKISPRALDLSAAALTRALVRATSTNHDVHTIIDIGESKSLIVTREGLDLRSMRIVASGGASITQAIQRAGQLSMRDAEELKRRMHLTGTARVTPVVAATPGYGTEDIIIETVNAADETLIEESLNTAAMNLIDQIAQSVEVDASTSQSFTQGITLVGGGALLSGLRERLQSRVGVPVVLAPPWAVVDVNHNTQDYLEADGQVNPVLLASLATAIGLAMWEEPR